MADRGAARWPQSTVPGEKTSPTQPYPTKPPPFDRQGVSDDDLIDFTPELARRSAEHHRAVQDRTDVHAAFGAGRRPGATKGTIQLPGSTGGGTGPARRSIRRPGMLYVPSRTNPFVADLVPGDPAQTNLHVPRRHATDRCKGRAACR